MKFTYLTDKIIWRIIILHIVATFFIILAAKQFAELNDIEIIKLVDKYGPEYAIKHLHTDNNSPARIAYYLIWRNVAGFIGLLNAFIISLIIFIKKKSFWLNALIVFIAGLLLINIGLFNNPLIHRLFFSFSKLFPNLEIQYKFAVNGVILLLFALFIFFSKRTNNFALNYTMKKDSKINPI